jgi:putative membrane protein
LPGSIIKAEPTRREIGMMGWYNACSAGGYSGGWMIVMTLALAALIGVGVWAVIRLTRGDAAVATDVGETPQQVLDRRLAAGEIDTDEYLLARQTLQDTATTEGAARGSS